MTTRPIGSANAAWLLSSVRGEDWRERAACADPDVEPTWFDHGIDGETKEERAVRHAMAKSVCAGCTVRDLCLGDFERGLDEGIRSGRELPPILTKSERKPKPPKPKPPAPEIKHGTPNGARRHYKRGEKPCDACAQAARDRRQKNATNPDVPIQHGTRYGAERHRAMGQDVCKRCQVAERAMNHPKREAS